MFSRVKIKGEGEEPKKETEEVNRTVDSQRQKEEEAARRRNKKEGHTTGGLLSPANKGETRRGSERSLR